MQHMQMAPQFRYTTREEMLADYRAAQARIDASTDRLFDLKPRANYEIRPVEPFRERSFSGGSYTAASPDGSRPGVFHLNTYDPGSRPRYGMESLLIHEGSPGHHFQISIQRELEHLPRIRRFGGFTAYSEGWGLYAETLGRELEEEWSVVPESITAEALVVLPNRMAMLVGQAWLPEGARVTPDSEHDAHAWWPADVGAWPAEADEELRRVAQLLDAP